MKDTPMTLRNEKIGRKVVEALESRHFEAHYCHTKAEAKEKVLELIETGQSISWGGTMSCAELGLQEAFHEGDYLVIDRASGRDEAEQMQLMREALLCDTYIMGTNAISEDGQLVNVDGRGNRVAAMAFGPKQVIIVAGINKLVKTVEDAVIRARTVAAPINAQRFDGNAPCMHTGSCGDCKSADCICSYIVTTRQSKPARRIKVILVGEPLGF